MKRTLYKVKVNGIYGVSVDYHEVYVVANNTEDAYRIYRKYLDENDVGFESDRKLKSIEVIATEGERLFIQGGEIRNGMDSKYINDYCLYFNCSNFNYRKKTLSTPNTAKTFKKGEGYNSRNK